MAVPVPINNPVSPNNGPLMCAVCHDMFNLGERAPKLLDCGHTFCLQCLIRIFDRRYPTWWVAKLVMSVQGRLQCPNCQTVIMVARHNIYKLPNDEQAIRLLKQTQITSTSKCPRHQSQPLNFFCWKCRIPVCRDCTVLDHTSVNRHTITNITDAIRDNSHDFDLLVKECERRVQTTTAKSKLLSDSLKQFDVNKTQLKKEIKEKFATYRNLLEQQEQALNAKVDDVVGAQKLLVTNHLDDCNKHSENVQELLTIFNTSRDSNDHIKMFTVDQHLKQELASYVKLASLNNSNLANQAKFKENGEATFIDGVSKLGDIVK